MDVEQNIVEKWKSICAYEGLYEVSNLGRVRSMNYYRVKGNVKILKLGDYKGYKGVKLYKEQSSTSFKVHRLVGQAFIPNPNCYPFINHKDENPSNNNVANLEWCTPKYNNNYGDRNLKISYSQYKVVYQYDLLGNLIKEWDSIISAEQHGFRSSGIVNCCSGRYKTHKGYIWRYEVIN